MDAPERPEGHPSAGPTADGRRPAAIVSHVDIIYRVYGAGRAHEVEEDESNLFARLFSRTTPQVGVREVHAVKDASFVAYQGESVGLIGRNGSGKSTLLRAIAGLIPPDRGQIYLDGRAALLGVNAVLMRKLSGARNVMIGGQALGLSKQEVRERFADIVEFSGIGSFIDLPMESYSSGMAARLRFAISTAAVPDILVVDEALGTGDADFRKRAQDRITQIRRDAGTVFMVSHNNNTIKSMCDRALWMEHGHLIMDGPSGEVVDAYAEWVARRRRANRRGGPTPPGQGPA
ncbi:ABC transporter ATP-binding protein [Ornithinimicrobium avium]|uniref:ABC transporter ATP-binding protein n=1 Tax=Ornithinimicrobium avium TaxID=2283195 RepID=A0A345NNZ2_9MICO|nr:ABC transporter ATP-binding protein [Ornithinimicrobium avium]AXH96750.1 ABC transporter ATP-binding protein [Ornithinimicrobium avium]